MWIEFDAGQTQSFHCKRRVDIAINLKAAKALGLTVLDHDAKARGIKRLRRESHETVKPRPIDLASDIRAKFGMI